MSTARLQRWGVELLGPACGMYILRHSCLIFIIQYLINIKYSHTTIRIYTNNYNIDYITNNNLKLITLIPSQLITYNIITHNSQHSTYLITYDIMHLFLYHITKDFTLPYRTSCFVNSISGVFAMDLKQHVWKHQRNHAKQGLPNGRL